MTDEATQEKQPVFQIQSLYLKDLSLEQPNSPQIFLEKGTPGFDVAINVGYTDLGNAFFEVTVTATVTAKIKDKVAYLVEGKQAGIFNIQGIPAQAMDSVLGINCPTIVYPYLRATIADAITKAGFPPIHLAEINFEAYFRDRMQQANAANHENQESAANKIQ